MSRIDIGEGGIMRIPSYTVLTRESTLVCEDKEELAKKQARLFTALFPDGHEKVVYHMFSGNLSEDEEDEGEVNDYDFQIQRLALRDGVDIVLFSTGNVGFVSDDGRDKDAFEIKRMKS